MLFPFLSDPAKCSTPYGIRGLDQAAQPQPEGDDPDCAQRLTASEGWIRRGAGVPDIADAPSAQRLTASEGWISRSERYPLRLTGRPCSTPYGIRGLDQHEQPHHAAEKDRGAQRLTASEGWIRTTCAFIGHGIYPSAQRLTASEGWIRGRG